jgi:hypothetical protein
MNGEFRDYMERVKAEITACTPKPKIWGASPKPEPIGFLPIPYGMGKMFMVEGGPFDAFEGGDDRFGVCLNEYSRQRPIADVKFDIVDFSVPDPWEMDAVCSMIVDAMFEGKIPYIGCMAGKGRTGLVMSCLCRAFGVKEPIRHVRRWYYPRAVETSGQEKFVNSVDLSGAVCRVKANKIKEMLGLNRS